ncbi:MAG TPA: 50S ribosomal protein L24 [Actinomycetota bacterium]|nr:50S ribosomal protein L24 [Actinomycetota bacterium]
MPGVSIRKDDTVMVMAGKDRGRTGRVVQVLPRERRVMVEGVARAKRHTKPSRKNQQGGIIDKDLFIDLSNVQLVCKSCGRPTRVGHRVEDGKKVRICRKCEAEL